MSHSNNRDLKELLRVAYQQKIDLGKVNWSDIVPFFQRIHSEKQLQSILKLAFVDFTNSVKNEILLDILASSKTNDDPLQKKISIIEKLSSQLQLVEPLSKQTQWVAQYIKNVTSANLEANRLIFIQNLLKNEVIHVLVLYIYKDFIDRLTKQIQCNPSIGEKYPNARSQLNNLSEFFQYYKQTNFDDTQSESTNDDRYDSEEEYTQNELLHKENQKLINPLAVTSKDKSQEEKQQKSVIYEFVFQQEGFQQDLGEKKIQHQIQQKFQKDLPLSLLEYDGHHNKEMFEDTIRQIEYGLNQQNIGSLSIQNLSEQRQCHQTTQTQQVSKNQKKKHNKKKRQSDQIQIELDESSELIELKQTQSEKESLKRKKCQDYIKEFEERLEADCCQSKVVDKLKPKISVEWIKKIQLMFTKKINCIRNK